MKLFWILPVLAGLIVGCTTPEKRDQKPAPGHQTAGRFWSEEKRSFTLNYLLYLPKEYDGTQEQSWPLVLFLHGSGERGTNLSLVTVHGPPKLVNAGREFPFILLSPQCRPGVVWDDDALLALLDQISREYKVDTKRVYVTGLSMGGFGTWSLGVRHPERFAAIAPICGGGSLINVLLPGNRAALKSLGVWAFHGAKDNAVPLEESQQMINALRKIGATDVELTVYPEAGHDSWTISYENPAFYEWMLRHSR